MKNPRLSTVTGIPYSNYVTTIWFISLSLKAEKIVQKLTVILMLNIICNMLWNVPVALISI